MPQDIEKGQSYMSNIFPNQMQWESIAINWANKKTLITAPCNAKLHFFPKSERPIVPCSMYSERVFLDLGF